MSTAVPADAINDAVNSGAANSSASQGDADAHHGPNHDYHLVDPSPALADQLCRHAGLYHDYRHVPEQGRGLYGR